MYLSARFTRCPISIQPGTECVIATHLHEETIFCGAGAGLLGPLPRLPGRDGPLRVEWTQCGLRPVLAPMAGVSRAGLSPTAACSKSAFC